MSLQNWRRWMIKVFCRTNDDRYDQEQWPTVLSCKPEIGELIESKTGKILRIVGITHLFCDSPSDGTASYQADDLVVELELSRRVANNNQPQAR
jgi:hypothetical protein